jgi:hypothetical protein
MLQLLTKILPDAIFDSEFLNLFSSMSFLRRILCMPVVESFTIELSQEASFFIRRFFNR